MIGIALSCNEPWERILTSSLEFGKARKPCPYLPIQKYAQCDWDGGDISLQQELSEVLEKWTAKQDSFQQKETTAQDIESEKDVFDKAGFLDRLMGDEELANEIFGEFLEDVPRKFIALKEAVGKGDAPSVQIEAHTLKGASANVGALALQDIAYQIELAGKEGDMGKAFSFIPKLDEQLEVLKGLAIRDF